MKIILGKYKILITFVLIFVTLIISLFISIRIGEYHFSITLLLGFVMIIILLFIFGNQKHEKNKEYLQTIYSSEKFIKIAILVLIIIVLCINNVHTPKTITLWEEMDVLQYFRAFILLSICLYVPGAFFYKLLFPNSEFFKKFKISPIIFKATIYPLISLSFIGISTLILDQMNLSAELIELILILLIISLLLIDLSLLLMKSNSISFKKIEIKLEKNELIIIFLALSISIISIGFQIGWSYLISGDPWDVIKFANFIGDLNQTPLFLSSYPNFWGYIIFGLSSIISFPLINTSTFLAPLSYLFITSSYFFFKTLLSKFKAKYQILSLILFSIFSGFLIDPLVSTIIFVNVYYFIYKSFSFCLFFISLSLFFILIRQNQNYLIKDKKLLKIRQIKLMGLGSLFLIISYMTYIYPLIIAITFLFIYSILLEKPSRSSNFQKFIQFVILTFLFFFIFDILMNFYLSWIIIRQFFSYFRYIFDINSVNVISLSLLTYGVIISLIIILLSIKYIIDKKWKISLKNFKKKYKKILKHSYLIFIFLLIMEFFILIIENFVNYLDLSENIFFVLIMDKFYLNLGYIGILGIILSFFFFKRNERQFFILAFWIIISFIFAYTLLFVEWFIHFLGRPINLPEINIRLINFWFDRLWIYSIPSLCVFASVGIFKLAKILKNLPFLIIIKRKYLKFFLKQSFIISLILFSFSGIIFTGIEHSNMNFRYSNTQIETLSWISENIPIYSGVVVGDNFFMGVGTDSITFIRQYLFYDIFEEDFNQTKCIKQIGFLKNETIQYAVISQFFILYLNKSEFTNNILIPKFYNDTLYQNEDLSVYYAPYFD